MNQKDFMSKKLSVKKRILRKASELFYIQGAKATGINQIIKESEVAKASFYQYFPSKNDLIRECIGEYDKYVSNKFRKILSETSDFNEFVEKWIELMKIEIQIRHGCNACPMAEAVFHIDGDNEGILNQINLNIDRWLLSIRGSIDDLKEKGTVSSDADSELISRKILLLYEGALTMWKLTGDINYIDDLGPLLKEVLLIK